MNNRNIGDSSTAHHGDVRERKNNVFSSVEEPVPFRGPGPTQQLMDVSVSPCVHRLRESHPTRARVGIHQGRAGQGRAGQGREVGGEGRGGRVA